MRGIVEAEGNEQKVEDSGLQLPAIGNSMILYP